MSGKNLKMVISKKGRTVKAPARLIAADDEPAQVLTQVEMKDENAQDGCYEVVYNHKLQDFVRAEDGMDDDDQYHKEMKTRLRYELDKNRILKNKISQLKEEGRKLLLLYHTHFKGLDADDDDQIKEEKNASKKEVKASTSFQSEEEESTNKAEAAPSPPKVIKETQVKRIAPPEKVSLIRSHELQTGVLNKTNNNLPPIKKRKEPENPETPDGPQQKVHCLTPSRSKEKILDDKFYITPHEAAYQVAIFASTAETKRVNEDCSYNWPCLTIQKWKRGSAKTYDCQIPLRYLPACQEALQKIYEINESHFN